jgi:nucleotide-binding universal stress UspA family protein
MTISMNKIIVAYDFSPEAKKALDHTVSIVEPGDNIEVLVVLPEPDLFFGDQTDEVSKDQLKIKLEALKLKYDEFGNEFTTRIVQGNVVEEIIKASDDQDCKMIVIGYKGVSKIGRFKLGNVSGQVAKLAKKPVLIIK